MTLVISNKRIRIKSAPINDPIKWGRTHFNYERKGDKYVLFSSGEDGVPNTKDDFYPQIQITDSSKIGLMKP